MTVPNASNVTPTNPDPILNRCFAWAIVRSLIIRSPALTISVGNHAAVTSKRNAMYGAAGPGGALRRHLYELRRISLAFREAK